MSNHGYLMLCDVQTLYWAPHGLWCSQQSFKVDSEILLLCSFADEESEVWVSCPNLYGDRTLVQTQAHLSFRDLRLLFQSKLRLSSAWLGWAGTLLSAFLYTMFPDLSVHRLRTTPPLLLFSNSWAKPSTLCYTVHTNNREVGRIWNFSE